MNPTFTIVFDTDVQSGTYGKWVITDTTDYNGLGIAPANVSGAITLSYPDGTGRIGVSGDILPAVSTTNNSLNIPLDSDGAFMEGTYTVTYQIVVTGNVTPGTYTSSITFEYCKTLPSKPTLDTAVDCLCAELTVTDQTDLGNYTTVTRSYTVTPPPNLGLSTQAFTSKQFTYNLQYTGTHSIYVNVATTYTPATSVTVKERLVYANYEVDVTCDIDLCGLRSCISKFTKNVVSQSNKKGGWDALPLELKEQSILINLYAENFELAVQCSNRDDITYYYNKIKDTLGCDCGCDSTTDNGNVRLTPICGSSSSGNTVSVVSSDNSIDVTTSTVGTTTTFDLGIAQSYITLISTNQSNISSLQTQVNNLPTQQYYKLTDDTYIGDVGNSASPAEEDLYDFTLTAAGNANDTLEDGDTLKITIPITFASATTTNKTVRVYAGGVLLFAALAKNIISTILEVGAIYRQGDLLIEVFIEKKDNTTQITYAKTEGTFNYLSTFFNPAINFGASQILKVTGQSAAGAANDVVAKSFTVEIFKSA